LYDPLHQCRPQRNAFHVYVDSGGEGQEPNYHILSYANPPKSLDIDSEYFLAKLIQRIQACDTSPEYRHWYVFRAGGSHKAQGLDNVIASSDPPLAGVIKASRLAASWRPRTPLPLQLRSQCSVDTITEGSGLRPVNFRFRSMSVFLPVMQSMLCWNPSSWGVPWVYLILFFKRVKSLPSRRPLLMC
jgi:hypothetical protein